MARGGSNPVGSIVAAVVVALGAWIAFARFSVSQSKISFGSLDLPGTGGDYQWTPADQAALDLAMADPDRPRLHR